MTNYIHARENRIESAQKLWSQVIHKHQLQCVKNDYEVNGFISRLCYLTTGNLTVRGVGKGQSIAEIDISASYEAIEHYLSSYCLHQYPISVGSTTEFANKYPLILERCNPDYFMQPINLDTPIPWVIYENISNNDAYAVPLATVDLNFQFSILDNDTINYEACSLYAASNGLASGASYEESVIHGALEVLERDAYSYFLIDTCILKKPLHIINKQTLPDNLSAFVACIEEKFHNPVVIAHMPSRYGVYVFLATFLNKEFEVQPRGSGASLNIKYALERAICELVQNYTLMHGNYVENEINADKIGTNVLMHDLIEFNVEKIIKNNQFTHIDYHDHHGNYHLPTLENYLHELMELIHRQNSMLLVNVVYHAQNGLTCTRSIIPGAEEFFLATNYLKMKPKPKTDLYITSQLGKKFNWTDFDRY